MSTLMTHIMQEDNFQNVLNWLVRYMPILMTHIIQDYKFENV